MKLGWEGDQSILVSYQEEATALKEERMVTDPAHQKRLLSHNCETLVGSSNGDKTCSMETEHSTSLTTLCINSPWKDRNGNAGVPIHAKPDNGLGRGEVRLRRAEQEPPLAREGHGKVPVIWINRLLRHIRTSVLKWDRAYGKGCTILMKTCGDLFRPNGRIMN